MEVKELMELFNSLNLDKQISLEELPELDLYMDQVIQLFDNKFKDSKRNEDDKALTKTMINNYAKGKLLMAVKNKKYTKEHLILMSLIYNLKGALSISDIKSALNNIVSSIENNEGYPLRELYKLCLSQNERAIKEVEGSIKNIGRNIGELSSNNNEIKINEFEKNFLLLVSFINISNMYRKMGEKLIDEYFNKI